MSRSSRLRSLLLHPVTIAAAVVATVVVLVWFQPQTLLFDTAVDDELPVAATSPDEPMGDAEQDETASESAPGATTSPTDGAMPEPELSGTLRDRSHPTSGTVRVISTADGGILRLEDLETDNGPDLFVYLSTAPRDAPADQFDDEFVDLGRLKGNLGNQNYDLPDGVDLERHRTVVIWCRRFSVAFGVAELG